MAHPVLNLFNAAFGQYLRWRMPRLERTMRSAGEFQDRWLDYLLIHGRHTDFGKRHGLRDARGYDEFREQVPVRDYDGHLPYINRMLDGERSVLWPGFVEWFAKSSGTTSARSKYLPVSGENLHTNHLRGSWDAMSFYYAQRPDANVFAGKNLVMGGSIQETRPSGAKLGDVSAVMLANFPSVARPCYTPSFETMLMSDYEAKLERTARESMDEDVRLIGGVPNWTMLLMRRILELKGAGTMREVWPNFSLFTHGGISFEPYAEQFRALVGPGDFDFLEIYNASEGYFGLRDDLNRGDMLLLVDSGVFYEFVPQAEWGREYPRAVPLAEVEPGVTYGMVITTNAGLWRYDLGDAVQFTGTNPYRFRITGRTRQFINTFGEEVMVDNTDRAVALACRELDCAVAEYTAAPVFLDTATGRGAHEWIVEFSSPPHSLQAFAKTLDATLQDLNSDYAAKRKRDVVLAPLILNVVPGGTFDTWMKARGKFGGQGKVPRLSTDRAYVAELLARGPARRVGPALIGAEA